MYKIVMLQAYFAAYLLPPDKLLSWYDHISADYITEYTMFETSDSRVAYLKFNADYNVTDIILNDYDFFDGIDCIAVEAYELRKCGPDSREKLIMRTDFTRVHNGGDIKRYFAGYDGFLQLSESNKVLAYINTFSETKTGIPYRYNSRKGTWENCAGRYNLNYFCRLKGKIRYEY